jgi:hypothetical protein
MEKIKGFERYLIDREGNVFSTIRPRKLKPNCNNGYLQVFIKPDESNIAKWQYIHRLIAKQFLNVPDNHAELWVNHKDGNKSNNVPENLEWTTISENILHAVRTGLRVHKKGIESHRTGKKGKQKWLYVLPDGRKLTYFELKKIPNYKNIYSYCWSNTKGYSKELLTH